MGEEDKPMKEINTLRQESVTKTEPVPRFLTSKPDEVFKHSLGTVCAGNLLDIATGEGGFIRLLTSFLKEYRSITGIDNNGYALASACSAFDQEDIRFVQMDAQRLGFAGDSFDCVNVSASLHHLADISTVLLEMKRVLKPGGRLVVSEMHADGVSEPQNLAVQLHHLKAEVDAALGIPHHKTFSRQELVEDFKTLDLHNIRCFDYLDMESDPMDPGTLHEIDTFIEWIMERALSTPESEALIQKGEALRRRIYRVGIQREPVVVIVGEKF